MPAQHQDVWYRPTSDIPLAEPRWAKMVEIRPTTLKGRRIVHHSIAYLALNNDPEAVNTGTASNGRVPTPSHGSWLRVRRNWAAGECAATAAYRRFRRFKKTICDGRDPGVAYRG